MGIGKRSDNVSRREKEPPKEPAYRKEHDGIIAAVWESYRNGHYVLGLKVQRKWIDGMGRTQFSDSFEYDHLASLKELLAVVENDMKDAIEEEKAQQEKKLGTNQ